MGLTMGNGTRELFYYVFAWKNTKLIINFASYNQTSFNMTSFVEAFGLETYSTKYTYVYGKGYKPPPLPPSTKPTTAAPGPGPGPEPTPGPQVDVKCRQCYTLADKALFSAYRDLGSNCKEERACPKGSHYC